MKQITMMDVMQHMSTGHHGHFAQKLADAWFFADSGNQYKIETAFEDLIHKVHMSLLMQQAA